MSSLHLTADFCREQEAMQRAMAAVEPLENRRKIALAAATAWKAVALLLEGQEQGTVPLDMLDEEIALEFAREAALHAAD